MTSQTELQESVDLLTKFAIAFQAEDYPQVASILDNTVNSIYVNRKYYLRSVLNSMMLLMPKDKYQKVYTYLKSKIFFSNPDDNKSQTA